MEHTVPLGMEVIPMTQIKKISTLLRKVREFYTKNGNEWGKGALKTTDGAYCLLGAAACVVTNKKVIDTMTVLEAGQANKGEYGANDIVDLGHWDEIPNVKGEAILRQFGNFFEINVNRTVDTWNDEHGRTRAEVLAMLRKLEKIALKERN